MRTNRIAVAFSLALGIARRPSTLDTFCRARWTPGGAYDPDRPNSTYLRSPRTARAAASGRQLVTAFGDAARRAGVQSYELSVDDNNQAAIGFYERWYFKSSAIPRVRKPCTAGTGWI
jgi:hypothetical protein